MIFFQHDGGENSYLVVVIEDDNLERMRTGDPITLNPASVGGLLKPVAHPASMHLLVCYERDAAEVYRLIEAKDTAGLLQHLTRGYQFKAIDGKFAKGGFVRA